MRSTSARRWNSARTVGQRMGPVEVGVPVGADDQETYGGGPGVGHHVPATGASVPMSAQWRSSRTISTGAMRAVASIESTDWPISHLNRPRFAVSPAPTKPQARSAQPLRTAFGNPEPLHAWRQNG